MPPNILFFFSDQQRADTLGCYGQPLPVTPNLDRAAAGGVRFERAFTCQPVCGPARACLQTGKYATEVGCVRNDRALPRDERTIAHVLSEAGYEVGYLGKWHLASNYSTDWFPVPPGAERFSCRDGAVPPDRRGGYKDFWLASDVLEFTSHSYDGHMFDAAGNPRHFPPGRYRADAQTDWLIEYLRTRKGDRPFFLFASYIEPHHQNDHKHYEGPTGSKERFRDFVPPGDLVGAGGDWREEYPDYLGCCASLDANYGRVCEALRELGLDGNTVVIYTSDHGSHFRTRNSEYKRSCHDASIHVPLIIRGPGFDRPAVVPAIASLIDLPPTILAAAGVTPPATMRGRPLQELLGGTPADWPEEAFVQISESHCGRAIRTADWTYSVRAPDEVPRHAGESDVYVEDCLYELASDPHQQTNLVREPGLAAVRRELAARLVRRMVAAGEREPEIRPAL